MLNPLVFLPGLAVLLFTVFEMPHNVKKVFFNIPVWISSSVIAIGVGAVGKGVLGPMTGFMTELILFPGLYFAKRHFMWHETRVEKKQNKKDKKNRRKDDTGTVDSKCGSSHPCCG